jgi:hypothetical protein
MAKAYAGSKTDEGGAAPGSGALNAAMEQREAAATGGRPMRGPGLDLGAMLGPMAGGLGLTPPGSDPVGNDFLRAPAPSRSTDHARENPLFANQAADEDRFSDIISEDLESLPSIRSFGSSPGKRMRDSMADVGPAKKKVVVLK